MTLAINYWLILRKEKAFFSRAIQQFRFLFMKIYFCLLKGNDI